MTETPDFQPNVFQKILPPFWFFGALAVMALISFLYPTPVAQMAESRFAGVALFFSAFAMAILAKRLFDVAGTPVRPFSQSTAVVESGLFRYSRNPMYLAMALGLAGFAVALGDMLPFLMIPVFVWIIRTHFILHEERLMENRFGQDYLDFKSRVRRWI